MHLIGMDEEEVHVGQRHPHPLLVLSLFPLVSLR